MTTAVETSISVVRVVSVVTWTSVMTSVSNVLTVTAWVLPRDCQRLLQASFRNLGLVMDHDHRTELTRPVAW